MNATVMEHDIIKCDSPPATKWYKSDDTGPKYYYLEITLDGTLYGGPPQRFSYYKEPEIISVDPNLGPIQGGTQLKIGGYGFNRDSCNITVRFGNIYAIPSSVKPNEIVVKSPPVNNPHAVVVAVGLNGQQFTKDKTLHFTDPENTFHYYENPTIYDFSPDEGLSNGGSEILIRGRGFQPTKYENGTFIKTPVYVRMLERGTRNPLGKTTKAEYVEDEEIRWKAPPAPAGTQGIISISLNNHQFYELYQREKGYSFKYLPSPYISHIDPEFGEVRQSEKVVIDVHGNNFDCPNNNCNDVKCKFGTDPNSVIVKGQRKSSNLIQCPLPNYPQPDVLDVEVSMNGRDYSNNKIHFGYYDPFVLRVNPKLVSKSGSTQIEIKGFGFVDSTEAGGLKVLYDNDADSYFCTNNKNKCVVDAGFVDKNTVIAPTLPFTMYTDGNGKQISDTDPVNVEVSVFNDKFTQNHIKIHYYDDPIFKDVVPDTAPANTQSPLMIESNFKFDVNDQKTFLENAEFKCRFRSQDQREEIFTHGQAISFPYKTGAPPTHIKCNTPIWPLAGRISEQVKMDVTANGNDFYGSFDFTFTDKMEIYRVAPLCGPNDGGSAVQLLGSGFKADEDVMVKWGVIDQEILDKDKIRGFLGSKYDESNDFSGSSETIIPVHQRDIEKKKVYDTLTINSPKLAHAAKTYGGPVYLEVGTKEDVLSNIPPELAKYAYTTSFAEYYYYKQPEIKSIHPHGGPIEGGTEIVVEGADFQLFSEYGVIPHCKIGDKVVKAKFESTVRIICPAPPGDSVDKKYPVMISLNGKDYIDTGKFFHYYKNSMVNEIHPTSGPNTGGTTIRLTGDHFSDLSNPNEFLCRFKPLNKDVPPKYISARYFNQTTILCASPGGFGNVDVVNVDISFNGIDYTNSEHEFRYYNIITASPRSGPTDGNGDNIQIKGQGFKDDGNIKCRLDNQDSQPSHISWDEIYCPILPAKQGKDFFGNVPFEITINGDDYHSFTGGFQYYEQPKVSSIFPKQGPNVGHGKIHFYGDNFRSDFQLSEAYCKVGSSYGKAIVIDSKNMECHISEIPLNGGDQALPAQISLNNASWTPVNKDTYYTPYGIHHLTPNSGPITGGTEITVVGSGFKGASDPKCRFGVPGNFATTSGKVLTNDKMVCQSPAGFDVPKQASLPFSVPFSIALNNEEYDPWTTSAHRFRFYGEPAITGCTPTESEVGEMKDVYLFSGQDNEFIEPIPVEGSQYSDYGILCRFGKYGQTPGVLLNSTTVKCVTPTIQKNPEDLDREVVTVSVAQNGQNFNEYSSSCDYVFTGTGEGTSFWPWIIGLLLLFVLLIAIILCVAAILEQRSKHFSRETHGADRDRDAPHVLNKRPRGVPSGPMEYDYFANQESLQGASRSNYRGTDHFDTRTNRGFY